MVAKQVRSFVFTFNNYQPETPDLILKSFDMRYGIIGEEVSSLGTPHLQGFIQLTKRMTLSAVGGMFPWFVEPLKGTPRQAMVYCKKGLQSHEEFAALGEAGPHYGEGSVLHEFGLLNPGPGSQTKEGGRWHDIYRQLQQVDLPLEEVGECYPSEFVRYYRSLQGIRQNNLKCYEGIRSCYFIYGKAGVGKSRFCHENFPNAYIKDAATKWWDGYEGQEVVILDELELQMASLGHYLKRWADRYKLRGEVKGAYINLSYKVLLITSNTPLLSLCHGDEVLYSALSRRYTEVCALSYDLQAKSIIHRNGILTKEDIVSEFVQPSIYPFLEGPN